MLAVCRGGNANRLARRLVQDPEVEQHVMKLHPIGRIADPAEMARAVLFLASDEASSFRPRACHAGRWRPDGTIGRSPSCSLIARRLARGLRPRAAFLRYCR